MNYCVYLLTHSIHNRTYLGITNNFSRRIRQHNNEIKGGAKYTTAHKGEGEWKCYLQIKNLTKSKALSIERTIKNKRKRAKGKTPLDRRLNIIKELNLEYELKCEEYELNYEIDTHSNTNIKKS